MSVYRVRVRCVGEIKPGELITERRVFLVEAEDGDQANKIATNYAGETARFGPAWREFQWLETFKTSLPYEVKL